MSAPDSDVKTAPADSSSSSPPPSQSSPSLPPNAPNPLSSLTPDQLKLYHQFISHPDVIFHRDLWWTRQRDVEKQFRVRNKVNETAALLAEEEQWREWDWQHEAQRWLRATKWSIEKAPVRFVSTMKWREEKKVDYILLDPPQQKLDLLNLCCPNGIFGFGLKGNPTYWERTGKSHVNALSQLFNNSEQVKEVANLHVYNQEYAIAECKKQSKKLNKNIESLISVLDMTGLSVAHRRCTKISVDILNLDEKNYPERMESLYCINCPRIFPMLYAVVKPFLDPSTVAKIHVISGNPTQRLRLDFDEQNIPVSYGGKMEEKASFILQPLDHILALLKDGEPDAESITKETLKAGKKIEKVMEGKKDDMFAWYVKTTRDDIQLQIFYREKESKESKDKKESNNVIDIVAKSRYDTSVLSQSGEFYAPGDGEFVVIIDNSFSYFKEKEVHWWVGKSDKGEQEVEAEKEKVKEKEKEKDEKKEEGKGVSPSQ